MQDRKEPRLFVDDVTESNLQRRLEQENGVLALVSADGRNMVDNIKGRHSKPGFTKMAPCSVHGVGTGSIQAVNPAAIPIFPTLPCHARVRPGGPGERSL